MSVDPKQSAIYFDAELLVANGAKVSIHVAAYLGDLTQVSSFLEKGIKVNAKGGTGFRSLHNAAVGGQKEVVEFLISKGAEVNAKDKDGFAPVHFAAGEGHKDV